MMNLDDSKAEFMKAELTSNDIKKINNKIEVQPYIPVSKNIKNTTEFPTNK